MKLFARVGYYSEAIDCFDQAISLEPNAWTYAHRGAMYLKMGLAYYQQALDDLNQAISLKPNYVWAIAQRGELHRLMAHYDEALVDFDQAIKLRGNFA